MSGGSLLVAGWVAAIVGEAQDTLHRYGAVAPVFVATRSLDAGHEIGADDVVRRDLPVGLLPDARLAELPVGRVARVRIEPGEPVVDSRLALSGVHGPAALVESGRLALSLPGVPSGASLRSGTVADLIAVDPVDGRTTTVARSVRLLQVDPDGTVTVAVAPGEVDATAGALVDATIVVAVHHP